MPRMRIRPSKQRAFLGAVGGAVMVGIGIFIIIPAFDAFGLFWTLIAVAVTGYNAFMAFPMGAPNRSSILTNPNAAILIIGRAPGGGGNETASRLRELESLRSQNLISEDEYMQKRGEILQDL